MSIEQHLTPTEQAEADRLLKLGYVWLDRGKVYRFTSRGFKPRNPYMVQVRATSPLSPAVVEGTGRMETERKYLLQVSRDPELQEIFSTAYRLGGAAAVEHLIYVEFGELEK